MNEERKKALDDAFKSIEKQFGKGSIMKLGDRTSMQIATVPTGSLQVDIALGVGGIPKGRIIEVYGPESSGKTTVSLHMIAEVQKRGGVAAFIDAEHALDPAYAANLGVDVEELIISQPDYGEQALAITESLVRSGAVDIVVIDSVAALTPKAEIDAEMSDMQVGAQARLMSKAMRKLTAYINVSKTTCVFINQVREKIGISYGNPETTTGGRALKFYSTIRLEIRKREVIKNGNDMIGARTTARVVKNKVAPPFKVAEFDIMYGEGISKESEILSLAVDNDLIKKAGSWFSYNDENIGQGQENAKEFLKENPEIRNQLEAKIREIYNLPIPEPVVAVEKEKEGK
ncbi:MAG: recombinase RecA [Tissierellia bacterium]|nr:recombinase RecA [Tissierellia bacterium]